jgi:hypothetical protein
MTIPEPLAQHAWLQKLVGEWTFESEAIMAPDQPPVKSAGRETVRALGPFWIVAEGVGEMPGGGGANTIMTIGYDPGRKGFVGTWIGSMMTMIWHYAGSLDAGERILTLETEGPDMCGSGGICKYRDIIEVVDDNHRTMSSQMLDAGGQWRQFMSARFSRLPVAG